MLQSWSRRTLGIAAITIGTVAASPFAERSPGYTFDMESTTTTQSMMPGGAGNTKVIARGTVNSMGAMRMEVVSMEGPGSSYASGDYFLTADGRMILVHPATKTYVDLADMAMTAMANLPPAMASQMTISSISGKTEKLDDGAPIDGRPTEHWRTTFSYSMNLMGQSLPTTVVSDYWAAKLPVKFVNPLVGAARSPIKSGPMVELVNKQIELAPKITDGIVIKTTSATTVSVMGQSIVTSVTAEMKNLKEANVDDATFAIPEGYTKASTP